MAKLIFKLSLVQSTVLKCHMILQKSFLFIDLLQPKTLFINCFFFFNYWKQPQEWLRQEAVMVLWIHVCL